MSPYMDLEGNFIISTLIPFLPHCCTLVINLKRETFHLLSEWHGFLGNLKVLQITDSISVDTNNAYSNNVLPIFELLPKLHQLSVVNISLTCIPLPSLTYLCHLHTNLSHSTSTLIDMLKQTVTLKSLDIKCDVVMEHPAQDEEDIVSLSLLTHLTLYETSWNECIPSFMSMLDLPSLQNLTLIFNGFSDGFLNIPFRTPQLHLLQLHINIQQWIFNAAIYEDKLIHILESLPNLNVLYIGSRQYWPLLIENIGGRSTFLPSLQCFDCLYHGTMTETWSSILVYTLQ
ncbi:uncharacterized protein ARMOST_07011 [Armillaria ostoyae]|uniref:F-box domain-containing protein n=1 Tax=Armillaria ostoyae TaxID=47428 RepID=A0A284R4K9_ARMOS|nr:uncharacterized protein ARMOST_07011 [Armillaria ostoyae]